MMGDPPSNDVENVIAMEDAKDAAVFNTGVSGIVFGMVITADDHAELPRALNARTTTLYVVPLVRPLTSYCRYCPTVDGNPIFIIDDSGPLLPYNEYWYPVIVLPPLNSGGVTNNRTYVLYADTDNDGAFGTVNGIAVFVMDQSDTPRELIARIPTVYVLPLVKDEMVELFMVPDCEVMVMFAMVCVLPFK